MLRFITFCLITLYANISVSHARDQVRAVGSSTVYPFVTVAAEKFGRNSSFKTPVIESTGTGGGMKLFCSGIGTDYPDLSNASRTIKQSELDLCQSNGITDITEIKLGFDGIVLANSRKRARYSLTKNDIFNALAKKIVVNNELVANPNILWSDVNASLPAVKIEIYGPPPTSGTRDAFVELVMESACANEPAFKQAFPDTKIRKKNCHMIREDGHFIESGENDNLIIQKLSGNPDALGIFGFSFLDQNSSSVQSAIINNIETSFETISDGSYPISRPLLVYAKNAHFTQIDGLAEFVAEMVSENAIGEDGYLSYRGLIPLSEQERLVMQQKIVLALKTSS